MSLDLMDAGVIIGWGNALVLPGKKPLSEQMSTQISTATWRH